MRRKPRILFVLNEKLGWTTYSRQLQAVLAGRDDFEWEVITPDPSRWLRLALRNHNMRGAERLFRPVDPISAYRRRLGQPLRSAIDRFGPDLVHFGGHLPAASLLGRDGAPLYSVALDSTRVNMNAQRDAPIWSLADREREEGLLRNAVHLFPWSDWAARTLINDYSVEAERVTIIVPSIDPGMIGAPQMKPAGRPPRVLFIGNDFLRKGGDMLHRWVTGPLAGLCDLHIVSGDPKAKGLGGPGLVVHGGVPHRKLLSEILPSMDLLCHPTQSDMSAYVVVEAAFAGLAAVTSNVGGIPELIVENETGWTLGRRDEAGFIRTLKTLLRDRDRLVRAGLRAREHAAANFDAKANYNRMCDLLKGLA